MESQAHTRVLLTVDTEVYRVRPHWRREGLARDIDRDIFGVTAQGEYGLRYQLGVLARSGLKAVFFVEPLFASSTSVGLSPLKEVVRLIRDHGQEVQLHLHPEWVPEIPGGRVPYRGPQLADYGEDEQRALLDIAIENLLKAGSPLPTAFRAGDFAANGATLRALRRVGLTYDSSYNHAIARSVRGLAFRRPPWDLRWCDEGLWEAPVTAFRDLPGHVRPCQLCACSTRELVRVFERSAATRRRTVVVVSHSFELLANARGERRSVPRRHVVRRFEETCRYLAAAERTMPTAHFSDLSPREGEATEPLAGSVLDTALRVVEQGKARIAARIAW